MHRRKLRSDKYKPPAGRLLEFYESDSSVEADEDTGDEAEGGDAGAAPGTGGAAKMQRRMTRSAVGKQLASAAAAAVKAVGRRGRGGQPPLQRWSLRRFRHLTHVRLSRKRRRRSRRKRKMRRSRNCRSMSDRRGGRRVLLPRGGGSWCRRRWRMPSDVDWRRSVVLQGRRRGCLRLLSLGCFGRRLGFQR
jgi:hypothetical protein